MIAKMNRTERIDPISHAVSHGAACIRERIAQYLRDKKTGQVWLAVHIHDGHLNHFKSGDRPAVDYQPVSAEAISAPAGVHERLMQTIRAVLQVKLGCCLCCGYHGTVTLELTFDRGECKMTQCYDEQTHRVAQR